MIGRRLALAAWCAVALAAARPAVAGVEVQARLSRSQLTVGESVTLEVVVRGVASGIGDPEFDLPRGLGLLGSGRTQNFSWVNGRSSVETVFRYEIGADAAGSYVVGPVRVRAGGQVYQSSAGQVTVMAAPAQVSGAGTGPASLVVDVQPPTAFVGEPVTLRVRLFQRARLAEDMQYQPPATPGFWAEKASAPETYYAEERGGRVLVTETRTRLYPLAAGTATVGEAAVRVVLAEPGATGDPFALFGTPGTRRALEVRSRPVAVRVRSLPRGEPTGYTGAVGRFEVTWSADRARTSLDVPVSVRLDVRGVGNLALIRPPRLTGQEFEVFASAVEDSAGSPGGGGAGRKRFQWTVLPRRQGRLVLAAPAFAWFDPAAISYRAATPPVLTLAIGPPLYGGAGARESFPAVFLRHPLDPSARAVRPWGFALAGLALGGAWVLLRGRRQPPADASAAAGRAVLLRALGSAAGAAFWRAAEDAAAALEREGHALADVRERISAARYGGVAGGEDDVRRALTRALAGVPVGRPPVWPRRAGVAVLAVAALGVMALAAPRPGEEVAAVRARAADQAARNGAVGSARAAWVALWREGARSPALAARLAWVEAQAGATAAAALWVLRGERIEARDPALVWVGDRVREGGGLVGARAARLPVRRLEWGLLGLLCGLGAALAWPRRRLVAAAVVLCLACGAVDPLESWLARRQGVAVVMESAVLEGAGVQLDPGQVVRVLERRGLRVRVAAGREVAGWVSGSVVRNLEDTP